MCGEKPMTKKEEKIDDSDLFKKLEKQSKENKNNINNILEKIKENKK